MQNQQNPQQDNIPDWFVADHPMPSKLRKNRILLIIFGVATLLLVTGGIVLNLTRPPCLNKSDYMALTGQSYDGEMASMSTFYTALIPFKDASATYDDTANEGSDELKRLTDFYQEHSGTSIYFTISNTYTSEDAANIMEARSDAIQKTLADAGVPADHIIIIEPELIVPVDGAEATDTQATTVSITSAEGCR